MDVAETRQRIRDPDEFALQVQLVFKRFLEECKNPDSTGQVAKYATEALKLIGDDRNTLFIDYDDIQTYDPTLCNDIIQEFYHLYPYLCRALATYVREEKIRQSEEEDSNTRAEIKKDLDKPQLRNKDYYVGFYNYPNRENIRDLTCTKIGTLTRIYGQVVRTHSVHPELIVGCFLCKDCHQIQFTPQQFRYTQPANCINERCSNRSRFELVLERSKFTDFQRLRIQETQSELPRGCIPRSFDVVIRGADQVECIQPGDQCDFVGTLLAVPDLGLIMSGAVGTIQSEIGSESGVTGLKSIGVRDLSHNLVFLACASILDGQKKPCINTELNATNKPYQSTLKRDDFTDAEMIRIEKMSNDNCLLENLGSSLFASIYGADDVKKGIILQLLGGVPKITESGTKLRGDINICLVGDPSTAKSQFLKIVTDFAPVKAVYASGKASSASGLTAAVARDSDGSFVIEAGALMLADQGICCIDEFDKMDLKDQVAIHEAMEQQTISISKAGVTATLNARASILAAANPVGSVYDTSRDLKANLNFSLPILSRFDLFFTLIDPRETECDRKIASRILKMHNSYESPEKINQDMVYSFDDIRLYLRFARKYYPTIPIEVEKVFVEEFVRLRTQSTKLRTSWRFTVRQLESLIRLSEAIARGRCKEEVQESFVREAAALIERTIVHVGQSDIDLGKKLSETNVQKDEEKGKYDGETESQPLEPTQEVSQKLVISRVEYVDMAVIMMTKLKNYDDENDENVRPYMKKSELIDWYLHETIEDIGSEEELKVKKQLCEKALQVMIKIDNIVFEITEEGEIIAPEHASEEDRFIFLNPDAEIEYLS